MVLRGGPTILARFGQADRGFNMTDRQCPLCAYPTPDGTILARCPECGYDHLRAHKIASERWHRKTRGITIGSAAVTFSCILWVSLSHASTVHDRIFLAVATGSGFLPYLLLLRAANRSMRRTHLVSGLAWILGAACASWAAFWPPLRFAYAPILGILLVPLAVLAGGAIAAIAALYLTKLFARTPDLYIIRDCDRT